MEKLTEDVLLKFLPDTLMSVRKEFGLDKPGVLKESLNVLEKWISEQTHFVKKDFSRDDLEKILITCKGSTEKAKLRIDKSCTIKNLLPQYFETLDARADMEPYDDLITFALLPNLTENHERIIAIRNLNYTGPAEYFNCYRFLIKVLEYIKKNDYNSGVIIILDQMNTNLKTVLPKLNVVELRQIANIVLDCYGLRVKKVYILSSSKLIDALVGLIKPIVPKKIAKRIQVYKDYRKLYKDLPVTLLPEEYEGPIKCIDDLYEDFLRALTSEKFVGYLKDMQMATTNEDLRDSILFNEKYLGAPGSLNNMIVD